MSALRHHEAMHRRREQRQKAENRAVDIAADSEVDRRIGTGTGTAEEQVVLDLSEVFKQFAEDRFDLGGDYD